MKDTPQPRAEAGDRELEGELTSALRRVDPPEAFANRVMQRAGLPAIATRRGFTAPWLRPWAAAAALAVMVAGAVTHEIYVRHEREKAALARRQFDNAMRVTDRALDPVREKLERLGLRIQE